MLLFITMNHAASNSIAVIIPTYNSMRFLKETLDSVLAQTLPPAEILVNDDGSVDGTADFAAAYSPLIKVFRRSNQRQAASRNFAATQTQCEWLAFLDHDDLWEPDKLRLQIAELQRNPSADVCYSARIPIYEQPDGSFLRENVIPVPPPSQLRQALYINTTFMPGSVLIRRTTYLAAGGFDPSFKYVEDWDLWLRLLHSGCTFAAVQQPLLLMRFHAGNQSKDALPALAEQKAIFRTHVLPRLPPATRWLTHQISQSGQESSAAYKLRENGDPRHLWLMASSLLRNPFADPHRYKVFAHMLYTSVRRPPRH